MKKTVGILIGVVLALLGAAAFLKWSGAGAAFLWEVSDGGQWLLPLLGTSALIDSINPCAFSILLITVAFLVSLGRLRGEILKIGASYIVGIFLVYLMIGLGILGALHLFNTPHFMAKVGAMFLVLWGVLEIVNAFFPGFPIRLKIPDAAHRKMAELMRTASLPGAFLLGGLVGLCEFPCTGGPYLMALGLLRDQATYLVGFGYLIFYNLIFILPLAAILAVVSNAAVLAKFQAWKKNATSNMRIWGGIAMILLGLIVFAL